MRFFTILAILFNLYMFWDTIKSIRKTIKQNGKYRKP